MQVHAVKKNKVSLRDYPFQRDIDNRILMSELSTFEVDVLRELLNGSLHTTVEDLADTLQMEETRVAAALQKLGRTQLLGLHGGSVTVNKELRKYYESQIVKFDEDFEPGVDYLLGLLSKVPIHILPVWYSISKTTDNINTSIIEKYLLTPRVYLRYLEELLFDDPILHKIVKDVFNAPEYQITATELKARYSLSRERFEEYMLQLEFHFVCCLSYTRNDEQWSEVVTPFYEWREYLITLDKNLAKPIEDVDAIKRTHPEDFGFLIQMQSAVAEVVKGKGAVISSALSTVMQQLLLIEFCDGGWIPGSQAEAWLNMSEYDRAIAVYRLPIEADGAAGIDPAVYIDRNVRAAEKNVKAVLAAGWIYFDDFVRGVVTPLGDAEPITLKRIARNRWKYLFPSHTEQEVAVFRHSIFERLYQVGIVATGMHSNKACFCVTPFGRIALGGE